MWIWRQCKGSTESPELFNKYAVCTSLKILGVTITNSLSVTAHVDKVLAKCIGSMYTLRVLKAHGLAYQMMQSVCMASAINRITYAGLAWWGLVSADDTTCINRFLNRLQCVAYTTAADMDGLIDAVEVRLLNAVSRNEFHILHFLSPPTVQRSINLRPRIHDFRQPHLNNIFKTIGISFLGLFINIVIPCPSLHLGLQL